MGLRDLSGRWLDLGVPGRRGCQSSPHVAAEAGTEPPSASRPRQGTTPARPGPHRPPNCLRSQETGTAGPAQQVPAGHRAQGGRAARLSRAGGREAGRADRAASQLYLRELLRLTHPRFYQHLAALGEDGLQLLFCHRWLLLCFKREFPAAEALRIWEACWAHYQTDYFHLFICVAIVAIYGDDVIEQQLATDQMLLHFGNLAMHMNGELVLRKARSLLYQFRLRPRIPCSLHDLCKLCGSGMWDSGYMPAVECTGHHPGSESCPYGGTG